MALLAANAARFLSPKVLGAVALVAVIGAAAWHLNSLHNQIGDLEQRRDTLLTEKGQLTSERDQLTQSLNDANDQLAAVQARVSNAERIALERELHRQRLDELNAQLTAEIRQLRITDDSVNIYLSTDIPDALYQRMQQRAKTGNQDGH